MLNQGQTVHQWRAVHKNSSRRSGCVTGSSRALTAEPPTLRPQLSHRCDSEHRLCWEEHNMIPCPPSFVFRLYQSLSQASPGHVGSVTWQPKQQRPGPTYPVPTFPVLCLLAGKAIEEVTHNMHLKTSFNVPFKIFDSHLYFGQVTELWLLSPKVTLKIIPIFFQYMAFRK